MSADDTQHPMDRTPDARSGLPSVVRTLKPADGAALDGVMGGRAADGRAAESEAGLAASTGLASVLRLLDRGDVALMSDVPTDLGARTAARIVAVSVSAGPSGVSTGSVPVTSLVEADGRALDAMLAGRALGLAEVDRLPLPAEVSDRRAGVAGVMSLLDRDAVSVQCAESMDGGSDRVSATMEALRSARQRERFAEQIDMLRQGPRTAGVSLRQVLSAAAILLLGVTLLLPVLEKNRSSQMQAACLSNLALAGGAFNAYAADYAGVFPRALSRAGASWWNVGRPDAVAADGSVRSNSAHLYQLVREGYLSADRLACRTNAFAPASGQMTVTQRDWSTPLAVSYSYQNQFTAEPLRVDDARRSLAVLADKNPLFVPRGGRLVFDASARAGEPSRQHNANGQNALGIDGHARWTIAPNFMSDVGSLATPDLFWSIQGKAADYRYVGNEVPADVANDSFLVP